MKITSFHTLLLLSSLQSFGQSNDFLDHSNLYSTPGHKSLILYDPSFWKIQLKLSIEQQQKINKINEDFYEHIKAAYSKKESSHAEEITQLLQSRSEQIWSTFHHRQKRKWEKLDSLNSLLQNSERTQNAF